MSATKSVGLLCAVVLVGAGLFGCSASTGTPNCPTNQIANADGKCVPKPADMAQPAPDLTASMDQAVTQMPDLLPSVAPDLFDGYPFGSSCNDNSSCASGECLLAGNGGVCTQNCGTAADCPAGWGCYGVAGVDGTVNNLCVMEHDQLCAPCRTAADCSSTSQDLCLPYATGGTFCGRDCSTISCPTGYSCQLVDVPGDMGGAQVKQCVPQSGACDCNSTDVGAKNSCPITTALGTTCTGTRTCQGATGWSSCAPPSITDLPDDTYADSNCDGIDGDITAGIFVSVNSGSNTATCGLTPATACKSLATALLRATQATKPYVYVQAGIYNEQLVPISNITIVGGYDASWVRGPYGSPTHTVRINGTGFDASEGQYISAKLHNLTNVTVMEMQIYGTSADPVAHPGYGSYAVHILSSTGILLHNMGVVAGNGARGFNGTGGTPATNTGATAGMYGGQGGTAFNVSYTSCNTSRAAGGGAGTNSCPDGDPPNGGTGGQGGEADCTSGAFGSCTLGSCSPNGGLNGNLAAYSLGAPYNYGEPGGGQGANNGTFSCGSPPVGGTGFGGRAPSHGSGGAGASSAVQGGLLAGNYWTSTGGSGGSLGLNGTGGGGGGGGGGAHVTLPPNHESDGGAGGGGGGAGGCRARGAGGGGGGGGGSFGIFAVDSTVSVTGGAIQPGSGGQGGQGGQGALGQAGGGAGPGGTNDGKGNNCEEPGGPGGVGTQGGHSGGGGGGNGGASFGIFSYGSNVSTTSSISGGSGGLAGPAGPAAPGGGANPGNPGNPGLSGAVGVCHGTTNCCPGNSC